MHPDEEREDREVRRLLAQLDHPAPKVTFGDIARRAARPRSRLMRLAAGVALVLGLGAVAYALPGSPLPRWVDRIFAWTGELGRPAPPGHGVPDGLEPSLSGIAQATSEDLLIRFESTHSDGKVAIYLTGGATVAVRAPRGAAMFTSGEGVIVVQDRQPGTTYEVHIPQDAPHVEIQVNGRRVFRKERSRTDPPVSEGAPAIVLPMSAPGPVAAPEAGFGS